MFEGAGFEENDPAGFPKVPGDVQEIQLSPPEGCCMVEK